MHTFSQQATEEGTPQNQESKSNEKGRYRNRNHQDDIEGRSQDDK